MFFTDQEFDPESGLYNYNARLYDPAIGRFISADTLVQSPYGPQTLNRYSYTGNNPLVFVDPSGHFLVEALVGAVIGGVIGGTHAAINGGWDQFAEGFKTGAIYGAFLGGFGQGIVNSVEASYGLEEALCGITYNPVPAYTVAGAFGGAAAAQESGGNVAQGMGWGALTGMVGASGLGGGRSSFSFFGNKPNNAIVSQLNRWSNVYLSGSLSGGSYAAMSGGDIDQGARAGGLAWLKGDVANSVIGHANPGVRDNAKELN